MSAYGLAVLMRWLDRDPRRPGARSILVVGHSHVGAIRHAAVQRREAGGRPHLVRTIAISDPRFGAPPDRNFNADAISPDLLAEIKRVIAKRRPLVCTAIAGNAHMMIAMIRPDEPWDFALSGEWSPPLDPQARIVAEVEAGAMLATTMADQLGAMARLRAEIGPFWQIESPPPVASPAFLAATMEPFFTRQPAYARNGISPLGLRYRMWRLSCRLFAHHCGQLGCGYVALPRTVFDQAGCLDERLAGDATHGNIAFGRHVIEGLDGLARSPGWWRERRRAASVAASG